MSNVDTPPNPYFSGINFNPSFFSSIISNYLTEAIANSKYLRLIGGILTGNLGIKRTPQVELDVNGKAIINNGLASSPSLGILGSTGTRLILFPGTATEPPFSLGFDANTLWYGTGGTGAHAFFIGTNERMRINNTQMSLSINTNFKMTQAILDLSDPTFNSSIYLAPAGAALLGTANSISQYSTSAAAGDTVLRGQASKKLYLQSGAGAAAITILDNGRIGIGTTDPVSILHLHTNNETRIKLTNTGTGGGTSDGFSLACSSIGDVFLINHENANIYYFINGTQQMRIKDGRTCIGSNDPSNIFQVGSGARLRISNDSADFSIIGTNDTDGVNNTRLVMNGSTRSVDTGDIHYRATTATGDHRFYTSETSEKLTILNSGNIGIANNNPGNILQVGDAARLRISNGPSDFTTIGTKEVDDANNTCIYIYGNTFSGNAGNISYYATTASGRHSFFTNGSPTLANTLATLSPDKCRFFKSPRAMNCNYENEGLLYPFTSGLVNVGGTTLGGYFIPVNEYTNSLMTCAFSHDSFVYTYWRGHVSIGNNNQIFAVSAPISGSNLLVESFVQQTTFITYIRVIPSVSFNASVLLRVKIYG
jgi:hypothetical protein